MAEKRKRRQICYYCSKELDERDLVMKKFPLHTKKGIRMYTRKFHYDCLPKYIAENGNVESRAAETSDWDKVYKYFKFQIMHLDAGTNLSPHAVERLQGLRVGQYKPHATNTRTIKRGYSFAVILNTLKYSKRSIDYAMKHVHFKSDEHMIDYIMKIVQNNINFIQRRMKSLEHQREKAEKLKKEEVTTTRGATYKRKGTGRRKVVLS